MGKNYVWLAVESFEKTEAAKEAWEVASNYREQLWTKWYEVYWMKNTDGLTVDNASKAIDKAIREDDGLQALYHTARVAQRHAQLARKAALEAKKGQAV